jgi:hypothetical protein
MCVPLEIPSGYAHAMVSLQHSTLQRPAAITFGIDISDSSAGLSTICDVITVAVADNIRLDNNVAVGPTTLTVTTGSGGTGSITGAGQTPGQDAMTCPSPAVAALVHKVTSRLGRRGRGRMFIPWSLEEGEVNEAGTIDGAGIAAVQSGLNGFLAEMSSLSLPLVLLHNSEGVTPAASPDVLTALKLDSRVGTQRRRQRG